MTDTFQTLLDQLQDADAATRSGAIVDLSKLDDARVLPALLDVLTQERNSLVLEDAAWALTRLGDTAVSPVVELLQHDDARVRHQAAHTLGKLGRPQAVDALIAALADADATVAQKAAVALGQIGDSRGAAALAERLDHASDEVVNTVSITLEAFGEVAIEPLGVALKHEQPDVRERAADVLGAIGSDDAIPALRTATQDSVWQVRFAAVNALSAIGSRAAKAALASIPPDADTRVNGLLVRVMMR